MEALRVTIDRNISGGALRRSGCRVRIRSFQIYNNGRSYATEIYHLRLARKRVGRIGAKDGAEFQARPRRSSRGWNRAASVRETTRLRDLQQGDPAFIDEKPPQRIPLVVGNVSEAREFIVHASDIALPNALKTASIE